MIKAQILPFIRQFIDDLSSGLTKHDPAYALTKRQELWLAFCITGIILTNSVCWSKFSRASFGNWSVAALSWMFRKSKIDWDKLFQRSVVTILEKYNIISGMLELDDTDRERSKNAKQIYHLGKQKDKKSGGYFMGQRYHFNKAWFFSLKFSISN